MNDYQLFWGDLHVHTVAPKGSDHGQPRPKLEEYYQYAWDVAKLDFFAVTDHDIDVTDHGWRASWWTANQFNEPGRFVALLGYEWSNGWPEGDDRNVYFLGGEAPLLRGIQHDRAGARIRTQYPFALSPEDLWTQLDLQAPDALVVPHHPGITAAPTKWEHHNSHYERLVEIASLWGVFERGQNRGASACSDGAVGHFAQDALGLGHQLGFIVSSDSHASRPEIPARDCYPGLTGCGDLERTNPLGIDPPRIIKQGGFATSVPGPLLAAVYAEELSREAVFHALRERRCYGAMGARIVLDFKADDAAMGQELEVEKGAPVTVRVRALGEKELDRIEIIANNRCVLSSEQDGREGSLAAELSLDPPCYVYARVTQRDGATAWSSPVWIRTAGVPEGERIEICTGLIDCGGSGQARLLAPDYRVEEVGFDYRPFGGDLYTDDRDGYLQWHTQPGKSQKGLRILRSLQAIELDEAHLESMIEFQNTIFPARSQAYWHGLVEETPWGCGSAALAVDREQVVGSVPFARRRFRVGECPSLDVAVLMRVGVTEELRGKGVGSHLLELAKELLDGSCDALMVFSNENHAAHDFYLTNGFRDVRSLQFARIDNPPSADHRCAEGPSPYHPEIFASTYIEFGGYYERPDEFWDWYANIPVDEDRAPLRTLKLADRGYALVRECGEAHLVLELAARDSELDTAVELLDGICDGAAQRGASVRIATSLAAPFHPLLEVFDAAHEARGPALMALPLDPGSMFRKTMVRPFDGTVAVHTPTDVCLLSSGKEKEVVLAMDDETFVRFLLLRLNIRDALHDERIAIVSGSLRDVENLAEARPYSPWVHLPADRL